MSALRQTVAVTKMNLRSVPQRLGSSLVIVIGVAGVVAVLTSVLAMSIGMLRSVQTTGRDDRAIVLSKGASAEIASVLTLQSTDLIASSSGIRSEAGVPLTSAEVLKMVSVSRKLDQMTVNVAIRGIGTQAVAVRPEIEVTDGRMFRSGLNEVVVGRAARALYANMDVGDRVETQAGAWTVVGVFESDSGMHESEILTDARTLASTGTGGYSSVTVVLDSVDAFDEFADSLTSNPGLSVDVYQEKEYFASQGEVISQLSAVFAYVVGGIMALGAMFGALNAMYAAVSARTREIATLRAIGFGPLPVVISVLTEALLLGVLGGLLGVWIVWTFLDGYSANTSGGDEYGQLVFQLAVTPGLAVAGVAWAAAIGFVGGLFPAVRAARMSVVTALRAT